MVTRNLDRDTIVRVRDSFALLAPRMDQFAHTFYARLFEKNPRIELMFRGKLKDQEATLGYMIETIVAGLDRIDEIGPVLQRLGRRHVEYGVREQDYVVFGEALKWTLAKYLGDAYCPETEMAWDSFFRFMSDTMQGACWKPPDA